jgi:hypothetical protein
MTTTNTTNSRRYATIFGSALLLTAALALPADAQSRRQQRSWDGWNQGRGAGQFDLDGTYIGMQQGCALVRDHNGQVIPLLGNPGDLQKGDHLLLRGQVQSRSVCGAAFRVADVERIYADTTHRYVIYDRRQDGDYVARDGWYDRYNRDHYGNNNNGRYGNDNRNGDRYNNNNDRYDNGQYNDSYGNRSDRRAVSVMGTIDRGRCTTLRTDRGEVYGLTGDLGRYGDGDRVRVIGFSTGGTRCGRPALEVQEVRGR